MIERITSHFDWVFQLPIESQCHFAVGVSFVGFVFAAFIRETCKKSLVRFGARAIGAASFFAVAAFANHVSHEYEKLNTELMVKRTEKASEIATSAVMRLISKNGYELTIGDDNGVRRVSGEFREHDGRLRGSSSIRERQGRRIGTSTLGDNGSDGGCNDGGLSLAGMLERAKQSFANRTTPYGSFQLPRETEGERF